MQNDTYYGAPGNSGVKLIRERLREFYDPEDFVTVINIDTSPVTYQFASPSDEETFSDYPGHKDTIQKKPPQRVTLQAGDTKLVPAYEADMMIEVLVKQLAMKKLQDKIDSGEIDKRVATTDWTDPFFQESLIKQIFVGKQDILNLYNQSHHEDVEKDLSEPKPVGRPRKEV